MLLYEGAFDRRMWPEYRVRNATVDLRPYAECLRDDGINTARTGRDRSPERNQLS